MINLTKGTLQFWENFLNCVAFISSPFFSFSIFSGIVYFSNTLNLCFSFIVFFPFLISHFSRKVYQLYLPVFSMNFLFCHLILIFEREFFIILGEISLHFCFFPPTDMVSTSTSLRIYIYFKVLLPTILCILFLVLWGLIFLKC